MSPYKVITGSDINFYPKASPKTNQPILNVRIELFQKFHFKFYINFRRD
jgi:hypothetical protein